MKRKNAIILSFIVILVTGVSSLFGMRAAIYGFDDLPVAAQVYRWVLHTQNSRETPEPAEVSEASIEKTEQNDEKQKTQEEQTGQKTQSTQKALNSQNAQKVSAAVKEASKKPEEKSSNKQNIEHEPDYIMEATAYVDTGQTKSQIYAGVGSVAVDPKVVPHGTLLYIEGYGLALATDTGRLIKGYSVDVWFSDKKKAMEWGRKKVKVWKVGEADIKKILATGGKYVRY